MHMYTVCLFQLPSFKKFCRAISEKLSDSSIFNLWSQIFLSSKEAKLPEKKLNQNIYMVCTS